MILRTLFLAAAGCAAALGAVALAPRGGASADEPPLRYVELPLAGFPRLHDGQLAGVDFVRAGVVTRGAAGVDEDTMRPFLIDAVADAVLGSPAPDAAPRDAPRAALSAAHLRAAVPVRLRRLQAPFAVERIVLLQVDHRSQARLRDLAAGR